MGSKNWSVCLYVTNFDPNYLGTGKTEWAKKKSDIFDKMNVLKKFYLSEKWTVGPGPGPKSQNSNILTQYLSSLTWDQAEI